MVKKEVQQALERLSASESVKKHSKNLAGEILVAFNPSPKRVDVEAEEALGIAIEGVLRKLANGELTIPADVEKSIDAVLMTNLSKHMKHHLLKRLARRSNKVSKGSFERAQTAHEEGRGAKPSRYQGPRFESFEDEQDHKLEKAPGYELDDMLIYHDSSKIDTLLADRSLNEKEIHVIKRKASGVSLKDIAAENNEQYDAVLKRFNRATEKAGLDKKLLK
ncbi:hypothetical protein [Marinimicrobium sp. C2-29]|uniref:hypothetical protein n=1 Tax=Marinimicrobium sp. C2-29 TaxID=3139825 RepID=UPI0031398A73